MILRPRNIVGQPDTGHAAELMTAAGGGSIDALAALYDCYSARAYRLALSICRDDGYAQDAVQEAFVSVWKSSASYQIHRGTVAAWLLTVVRHRAIDQARRHLRPAASQVSDSHLDDSPTTEDVSAEVLRGELAKEMRDRLARLPEAQRAVIELAFYGELSHTEIADTLGLPTGTVKGRMRLGLSKLRGTAAPVTIPGS